MKSLWHAAVAVAVCCFARGTAAEIYQVASVHDSAGRTATNTVLIGSLPYTNVTAWGQAGGVRTSTNASHTHYAGFLHSSRVLRPDLDADGDGLPDEMERDNDADGLSDLDELIGGMFDPQTPTDINMADTDGDGVSDGDEARAGTNPRDADHYLRMISIEAAGPVAQIRWVAREGWVYRIRSSEDVAHFPGDVLDEVFGSPGLPPWRVSTNTYEHPHAGAARRHYFIELP